MYEIITDMLWNSRDKHIWWWQWSEWRHGLKRVRVKQGKKTSAGTFCIDFCNTSTISKIILIVHLLILKKKNPKFSYWNLLSSSRIHSKSIPLPPGRMFPPVLILASHKWQRQWLNFNFSSPCLQRHPAVHALRWHLLTENQTSGCSSTTNGHGRLHRRLLPSHLYKKHL